MVDREIVNRGMQALMIDALGLDKLDREILRTIIQAYEGGPVGSETLAISIGESVDTLEDVYEPYLIQRGLLQRTPRGRMATRLAYEHLELRRGPGVKTRAFSFKLPAGADRPGTPGPAGRLAPAGAGPGAAAPCATPGSRTCPRSCRRERSWC